MSLKRNVNQVLSGLTGYELTKKGSKSTKKGPGKKGSGGKRNAADPPVPRAAPGSRKLSMFFDEYPRFYETSVTAPYHGRLNSRYSAIFEENKDVLEGAKVLDIASHDGRWSLAALKTGASHVVGIEAKDDLVASAHENLKHYGIPEDQYSFLVGDVHEVMRKETIDVDVVLCLGFLYHTLRYNELFSAIKALDPKHLIIDTVIEPKRDTELIKLNLDRAHWQRDAVPDAYTYGDRVLVGSPSIPAMKMMFQAYGFEYEGLSDWGAILRDNPGIDGVNDYSVGRRVTVRARAKD